MESTALCEARAVVSDLTKRPEAFLEVRSTAFEAAKRVAKTLYDLAKASEGLKEAAAVALNTLPELIIEDFDEEQVWAGVDLQNKAMFDALCAKVSDLASSDFGYNLLLGAPDRGKKRKLDQGEDVANGGSEEEEKEELDQEAKKRVRFEDDEEEVDNEEEVDGESDLEDEEEEDDDQDEEEEEYDPILNDPDFQHMSDSDGDDLPLFENASSDDDNDGDDAEEAEAPKSSRKAEIDSKAEEYMEGVMKALRGHRDQPVEDRFFKLSEMEAFLEKEDANEERRRLKEAKGMAEDSDDEDEGLNLFGDTGGATDEEDQRVHYRDYFATSNNDLPEEDSRNSTPADLLGDDDDDGVEKDLGEVKSTFEEAQLRLKKRIKKMEEEAVSEKPWQLTGEIAGPARPENSLLQEHLDYDSVAKSAPIITEEVSKRLEDIILQRIKDRAWDDVERKIKPLEDPYEYKKKLVLDHEKSKLSLAQIYEQEYLQQKSKLEDSQKVRGLLDRDDTGEIPKEVGEIQRDTKKLFAKLDTLTHFHYTPKSLSTELKIIRNLPSIAMEEVAPIAQSDATLLAPQEVVESKKGEMIGSSERTETDKKRERRKKKSMQRAVQNEKEKRKKLVDKLNPGLGNKYSKKKMMHDIKEAEKKGHITTIKDKGQGKTVKSSSAFFNQLQHETSTYVKDKTTAQGKKKKPLAGSRAVNFKL